MSDSNKIGRQIVTEIATAAEPFLLQKIKDSPASAALLFNKIILIPSSTADPGVYPKTDAGFDSAGSAAASGATIYIPPGTFTADHSWTDGVEYWGAGRDKTIFTGKQTIGTAVPNNLSVNRTANDANELTAVEVTGNKSPQGFGCDFTAIQSGSGAAYGVKILTGNGTPRFENCFIDGQSTGGTGKGIYQPNSITGEPEGPAVLTVVYNNGNTTFADSFNFSAAGIGDFVWKIDYDWASLPANGEFRVRLTLNSGTGDALDIYNLSGTDPTVINAGYTPWLGFAFNQYDFDGETFDHASGIFTPSGSTYYTRVQFSDGAGENTDWTMAWMRWYYNAGADFIDLFLPSTEETVVTTAVTTLRWCKVNGSTTDIDAGSSTIKVYACDYDPASIAGTVEQLQGDRGAWDVANYGTRHASDFAAGDSHHPPVTLAADADTLLGLSGQELSLDSKSANTVLSGPASGAAADPTFRALVNDDLPEPIAFKSTSELAISSDAITVSKNVHTLTSESGFSDDLATISGGTGLAFLALRAASGHVITVKHGTGNVYLNSGEDFELSGEKVLLLFFMATKWSGVGVGGGGGGHTIQDEGTGLTQRTNLNFVGAGVTVTDDAGNDQTDVTIGALSISGNVPPSTCQGRLTLTTGTPVTTSDVTAATTVYFSPYKGNLIGTYDGVSAWTVSTFTEKSLSLSGLTANTNYDIFIVDSTLALEAVAWTNDTTRATALVLQDGIYVKSGATTRRYLGTIRITGTTGQCEDSLTKRYVWNYYNRTRRALLKNDGTSHTYATNSQRAWNNDTSNKVEFVLGLLEEDTDVFIRSDFEADVAGRLIQVGVSYDSFTSANVTDVLHKEAERLAYGSYNKHTPGIGYHFYGFWETNFSGSSSTFNGARLNGTIRG